MLDLETIERLPSTAELVADLSPSELIQARSDARRWIDAFRSLSRNTWKDANINMNCGDRPSGATYAWRSTMQTQREFLDQLRDNLSAECCLMFLVSFETSGVLELEAVSSNCDKFERADIVLKYECADLPGKHRRIPVVMLGESCGADAAQPVAESLFVDYQWIDIPLLRRKGDLWGLVRVGKAAANIAGAFDRRDRVIADKFVERYASLVDDQRNSELLSGLGDALDAAMGDVELHERIASHSMNLMGGDRCDLVLWDHMARDLVVRAQAGSRVEVGINDPVPIRSLIREVWACGGYKYLPSVGGASHYYGANPQTQSEIAIRLDWNERTIGVLNVESFREEGFDAQDLAWFRTLGQWATGAIVRTREEVEDSGVLKKLVERNDPSNDVLKSVLLGVRAYSGCDASLIYYADCSERVLRCVASLGCDHLRKNPKTLRFRFEDKSLACKVFCEKLPYFSADAETDPVINQEGRAQFEIQGPIAGMPLIYDGRAVGVIVVWSREGTPPTPAIKDRLGALVQLAAPSIAAKADRCLHQVMIMAAEQMLMIRQKSKSDDELLQTAVNYIGQTNFDRVRLFKYEASERVFVPYCSAGMADPQSFRKTMFYVAQNKYAEHTVATAIENPKARVYNQRMFGPDPACKMYEKEPTADWIVVPLVVHGRLYGQIVVDNLKTGRPFDSNDLQYLNFLGTLLAETLAHLESVQTMAQRAVPVLLKHLSIQDSREVIIHRFLFYITCGEGLGFTRALFLEWDRRSHRLVYLDGVGPTCSVEFDSIVAGMLRGNVTLDRVLCDAPTTSDDKLDNAMGDFEFKTDGNWERDFVGARRIADSRTLDLRTTGPVGWSQALAADLNKRIDGNHFLARPLYLDNEFNGLFIVDRKFQERKISETDYARMDHFVELAGFLLTEWASKRRFFESVHEDAMLGQLSRLISDKLNAAKLPAAYRQIQALRESLAHELDEHQESGLAAVTDCIEDLTQLASGFNALCEPISDAQHVNPFSVVDQAVKQLAEKAKTNRIDLTLQRPIGEPRSMRLCAKHLTWAVVAIVDNAIESLSVSDQEKRIVQVIADYCDDDLVVEVVDNGPGFSADVIDARCRLRKDAYTSNSEKGFGFGLLSAQQFAQAHLGTLEYEPRRSDERGARVVIRIPINRLRTRSVGAGEGQVDRIAAD